MPDIAALRPATRAVLTHLEALGGDARGCTFAQVEAAMGFALRTVRRAMRELEGAGLIVFSRNSLHEKVVMSTTLCPAEHARNRDQNGPKRPKTAQVKTAQNGPKRPKVSPPLSSSGLTINQAAVVVRETRARESIAPRAPFGPQQQRQQLLGLTAPDDEQRSEARAVLVELDHAVRGVWLELGTGTHGFIAVDDASVAGLAVALRRYPLGEIVDCVRWSARRLAEGRLSRAWFATTFRGNGFCARHAEWQDALRTEQRAAAQEAAIAADASAHREAPRPAPSVPDADRRDGELTREQLGRLGLEALERMAGWHDRASVESFHGQRAAVRS